nr:uncharacterized protein LOC133585795 [Nerophis lumbriciformis]
MAGRLEDHLQCPTCLDIFKDPVILLCSHSFCRACLQQWKDKGERSCPVCRTEFSLMDPPLNLALRNMCENLSRASLKSEDICSFHEEKLQLFCLDHQELVCLVCRDAEIHIGHTFRPLKEVVKGHRDELQKGLQKAKERLQDYNDCRENCNEQVDYIKVQKGNVERKIKKDFEDLRRFLDVEEEARLTAVREEEKKKSQTMKEKMAALDRQMAALSDVIRNTEEQLASGNVSFMKKFKTAMSRIQELTEKPQLLPGGLLDEAKHVGNLKFKVWERMKETLAYSPVVLDPNTANPRIRLSEDLTGLSWEEVQQVRPKNPEREEGNCVQGGALDLGRHVWDVEVGDNNNWAVGVMWGDPCLPVKMTGWFIGFRDGKYKKPGGKYGEWNPPVKVQRIRVEVDMKERAVSFSEPLTNTELWNTKKASDWPDLSGNTKMYPYFDTFSKILLKIIRIPPGVTTAISQIRAQLQTTAARHSKLVHSKTMGDCLGDHLTCPTCLDIYKHPVILPCSHSFCRACLQQWKDKGERSCPLCRTEFSSMDPPFNLTLRNICENLSQVSVKSEDMCSLHQEELKLFCLDHRELVCHICRDSEIHIGHTFRPLKEIVKGHHKELQEGLQKAKERLKYYNDCRENCNEQVEYIKVQKEKVEHKIKKDFEELRRFLDVEEEARLAAAREEETKKNQTMKEKMAAHGEQTAALSDLIRSTEEQLASGNVFVMKKFKTAMSRIQELPKTPQLLPRGLLDEAKHVGNLKFKVWERMKETLAYSPVILDPNTADPRISLSEDLTTLSWVDVQQERPKNPERRKWENVLGCTLDSGRHVWDVEVGDNDVWYVGVAWGNPCLPEKMTGWFIGHRNGKYREVSGKYGEWNPSVKVQRIRVEVDMNERSLSFSETLTCTELWKTKKSSNWPDLSGNTKMYPYFSTKCKIPLKIIPILPGVTTSISLQSC